MVTIPLNEGVTSAFWPLLRLDLVEVAPVGLNAGDRRTPLLPASLGRSRYLPMTAILTSLHCSAVIFVGALLSAAGSRKAAKGLPGAGVLTLQR